jgi:predicted DNA-binding transcriptional regulator YafY
MELNIFERQLQLMLMLAQNRRQTKDEICRLLGFSTRTFYRYLDAFRRMGFVVEKDGECYRLDKSSPFFQKISSQVQFTDSEAILLGNVLDSVADASPEVAHLKNKLLQLYDNSILQRHEADPVYAENLHQLYRAIRYGRVAVLRGYRSLRSDSVSDRLVEPFQFLSHNEDIRCYEHSTGQCKTFKVERIGRVVMLDDVRWSHEDEHRTLHTDLFHFSDEQQRPVTLRLNTLAKQLLLEEYPAAATQLTADGDHWLLRTQVCSWKGVGRFVLGLPGAVEVVDCPEFLNYLRQQPHF